MRAFLLDHNLYHMLASSLAVVSAPPLAQSPAPLLPQSPALSNPSALPKTAALSKPAELSKPSKPPPNPLSAAGLGHLFLLWPSLAAC